MEVVGYSKDINMPCKTYYKLISFAKHIDVAVVVCNPRSETSYNSYMKYPYLTLKGTVNV